MGLRIAPNLVSTFSFFWDNGYEAWTADKRIRRVARDEIRAIAESGTDTTGTHNFLFMEAGKKETVFGETGRAAAENQREGRAYAYGNKPL
jgi:hypothetical protein